MNRRKMIKTLLGLSLFILFSLIYYVYESPEINKTETKIVTKIIDGDTVIVQGGQNVRFLDVDCDERGKACYNDAKNYIEARLLNQQVELISGEEDEDIYDRKLRYIFLDGVNINKELIEKGYCVARFESENAYQVEMENAESYAIANKIGCKWGNLSN